MAGSEAGHAFPAFGLASSLAAAGDDVIVYTGVRWIHQADRVGVSVRELPGLAVQADEDDEDAGAKLSARAGRMATALAPALAAAQVDLVISDVITRAGGWAAELIDVPWLELCPHPLYDQSTALPPIGAGMAAGTTLAGKLRDRLFWLLSERDRARGRRETANARRAIGLPPVPAPAARLIATLPGLEVHRPDWPADTHLVGPLSYEPTDAIFERPIGIDPLVVIAPSTAQTGEANLGTEALDGLADLAERRPVRVVYSALTEPPVDARRPAATIVGTARQDEVLADASVAICGAGHGMLAKALSAGVPVVMVPGGGDQWELANRVARAGAGLIVRPAAADAIAEAVERVLDDAAFAAAARMISQSRVSVVDPVDVVHRVAEAAGRASSAR